MKRNLTVIGIILILVFTGVNLSAEETTLLAEEIYDLSRFDGLTQDIPGPMGGSIPKSFFTRDIMAEPETKMGMFHTTFSVDMAENADYVLVYHSLLSGNNQGHIIISVKRPDGLVKNYLILIQLKDELYEIPCCKSSYAFGLSGKLGLLKQEMTD